MDRFVRAITEHFTTPTLMDFAFVDIVQPKVLNCIYMTMIQAKKDALRWVGQA